MNSRRRVTCLLLGLILAAPGLAYHVDLPAEISPLQATWLWGHHSIPGHITHTGTPYFYFHPHTDAARIADPVWSDVASKHVKPGAKTPAVLVLHGCSGLSYGTTQYRRYFIGAGYAVFEPDSFARPGRKACDDNARAESFRMRLEELSHALTQIHRLEWVDRQQLFLLGISEGGAVAAAWRQPGFAAHLILAHACSALPGRNPAAPRDIPVLAIVGELDPKAANGHCETGGHAPGSRSIVLPGDGHDISELHSVGAAVDEFLRLVRKL